MPRGPRPGPLPESLSSEFTVRAATASGATLRRLRAHDLDRRVHGVRAPAGGSDDFVTRCRMFSARLPDTAVFSHISAARLLAAPLPGRDHQSLHIAVPAPARAPHAAGIAGHSLALDAATDVRIVAGLRVTSPGRTWVDLASVLTLPDLVAVGDHLIHHRLPMVALEELIDRTARAGVRRGIARARRALPLLDPFAESRPESLLRLILAGAGLPTSHINRVIVDSETGRQVRPDFSFPDHRVIVEYQGDYHRGPAQWRADMRRRTHLEMQGWTVIEANWDDIRDPRQLVERIRRALAR